MITQEKQGSASISILFSLNYVTKLQPISEYKQTALEHFDHIQVEEKMGLSGIDSATRTLYQQFGYRSSNDISLEKMQRRGRYFSDDEASWR